MTEDWYFASHRLELARALHRKKWRVGVACTCGSAARRIRREGFSVFPVDFCRQSLDPRAIFRSLGQIRKAVSKFQPDLVVPVALRPILFLPFLRTPIFLPAVNLLNGLGTLRSGVRLPLSHQILALLLKKFLRLSLRRRRTWTVTQNEEDYQEARRLAGPASTRVFKIPGTGIDFSKGSSRRSPLRQATLFLFVGRLLTDKGLPDLMEAFATLRGRRQRVFLWVAGQVDPANPASISPEQLARWKSLPGIRWLGQRRDIPALLRAADCLVVPSYREGLPRVLLEAAVAGRPVIASDISGCREIVQNNHSGLLVEPRNPRQLAAAMASIHQDSGIRQTLAKNLTETVRERCASDKLSDIYDTLFRKAIAKPKSLPQ